MASARPIRREHTPDGSIWWLRMKPPIRSMGDVARAVSPRRHGCRNRRRIRYIVYNKVANKSINSLKVNGFN
jgi:hypothetical protein